MPTLLKYVIFDGEANQTLLGSIRSISAIQVFNVSITHPNLIASVAPVNVHHHTYGDIFLVELVMIFVGMPCVYGPVKLADVSVQNCKGIISLSDFQLWLAYLWSGADCFLHGVGAAIIRDTQEFLTTCAGYLYIKFSFYLCLT